MKVLFIRHGQTKGNKEKRYVGSTEEGLLEEGVKELCNHNYPSVETLFVSPRLRCIQTAEIIYPSVSREIVKDFAECSFGDFEYKNYMELSGNVDYQKWIDSGGRIAFPGGESREEFQTRCVNAFNEVILDAIGRGYKSIGFIIHGGTIMSILDYYSSPHKDFYEWQVGNGLGFQAEIDNQEWLNGTYKIHKIEKLNGTYKPHPVENL